MGDGGRGTAVGNQAVVDYRIQQHLRIFKHHPCSLVKENYNILWL